MKNLLLFGYPLNRKYEIPDKIMENLKKAGYTTPTPIQMQAIPIIMEVTLNYLLDRMVFVLEMTEEKLKYSSQNYS